MRMMRITTNYPAYLRQFYEARPGLAGEPYDVQFRTLMADCYGWADFWTRALGKIGYESWEPVGNAEAMQKAWARENGARYDEGSWLFDIVTAQARRFRPDVVLVNDCATYAGSYLRRLRAECPSIRVVVAWCGAPWTDDSAFRECDFVLSNIRAFVVRFRESGCRSEHLRHAFAPSVLEALGPAPPPTTDFSFVGSIVKREGFHNHRERILKALVERTGLEIHADAARPASGERTQRRRRGGLQGAVDLARSFPGANAVMARIPGLRNHAAPEPAPDPARDVDESVARRARPPLFGTAMYRKLSDSRVTLNTHIDAALGEASNMRLFEATGVGTCLLTERQPDLHEIFEPDVEVAAYGCAEEAAEKARYLLGCEDARRTMAGAGQRRTLRDHGFDLRAQRLDEIVRRGIG